MQKLLSVAGPLLAIIGLPLLFWPTLIMIFALVKQANAQMVLKPKHIIIFIGVQILWLILILGLSYTMILKPLNLHF
ncbi:MAG: hypothetical protein A2785_01865 [Candidatus Chisholmbacteria bacterium RIFCSPHIGHO2_01_FULL_49_18]|uniref:Uncharacterized protein n=2 Tax=Candidatus Chisholmiibacteriota TaxID=1817900 RepID=A0A1G1VMR9_9BACT|nr:MAG: hypothetical protein A2785_01865 [Candidatus Chisholmbacteria bacterium RIFCSPHIGHO2_01_FULL_49_18]OGY21342.1 MAG: hypothetical protein A3A65_05250 [Candidatus Chisholmbacteria bacterium RIFCSPLOWO2_01_FULL_49_14]